MRSILLLLSVCLVLILFGCSRHHESPMMPASNNDADMGNIIVLASGTMNLDYGTVDNNNRELESYIDVTSIVGSNFTFKIDEYYPPDLLKITLKINNTSPFTVHDVCIVFDELYGKTVLNPDSYIDIFEPWDINPFIAFRKEASYREFPPGVDTEELLLKYPGGNPFVDFFIIAHLGGNTGGVYEINGWGVGGELTEDGGSAIIGVNTHDHQMNTTTVIADTSVLTGGMTTFQQSGFPNPWTATISNTQHAPWGTYTIPVMAMSPSSPQYHTFNFFEIDVLPSQPAQTRFGEDIPIYGDDILNDFNIVFTDSRSMACEGDNFYLVFCNMNNSFGGYILFTRSTDGGESWTPVVTLTTPNDDTDEIHPSIAVLHNNVYIAYEYQWNSGIKVNLLASSDYGATWNDINPSGLVNGSYFPSLCIGRDSIYDVLYVTYVHNVGDAGRTWVGRAFTDNLDNWDCYQVNDTASIDFAVYSPSIACDSNFDSVMVTWENEVAQGSRAYFDKCLAWPNWGTDIDVSDIAGDKIWEPRISINPLTGVPGIIYRRDVPGYYRDELRFTKATDRFASSFLPSIAISDNQTVWVSHHSASISCDSGGRWMVAFSREDAWDIPAICYFDESLDDGVTWGVDQAINDVTDEYAFTPVLASNGHDVCVAWSDSRTGKYEMYVDHGKH